MLRGRLGLVQWPLRRWVSFLSVCHTSLGASRRARPEFSGPGLFEVRQQMHATVRRYEGIDVSRTDESTKKVRIDAGQGRHLAGLLRRERHLL